jgi:hypothetical protein
MLGKQFVPGQLERARPTAWVTLATPMAVVAVVTMLCKRAANNR